MAKVLEAMDAARAVSGRPTVVVADTVKGKGVSFAENTATYHNAMLTREQYEQALAELDAQLGVLALAV